MLRLRDIMTTEVHTVTPGTSLGAAMALFAAHHIGGAPVVEGERVVGVISASDIVSFATTAPRPPLDGQATPEPDEWTEAPGWEGGVEPPARDFEGPWEDAKDGRPADGGPAPTEWDPLRSHTVADAMTWGVYALPPGADVAAAAECMRSADVHRLLVLDEGRLLGIVTTMDLVRAIAEHRIVRRTFVFDRTPMEGAPRRLPG